MKKTRHYFKAYVSRLEIILDNLVKIRINVIYNMTTVMIIQIQAI